MLSFTPADVFASTPCTGKADRSRFRERVELEMIVER